MVSRRFSFTSFNDFNYTQLYSTHIFVRTFLSEIEAEIGQNFNNTLRKYAYPG